MESPAQPAPSVPQASALTATGETTVGSEEQVRHKYSRTTLLALRESPLVKKHPNLPPIEFFHSKPEDSSRDHGHAHRDRTGDRPADRERDKDKEGSRTYQRGNRGDRDGGKDNGDSTSLISSASDVGPSKPAIVLAPPKMSFASSLVDDKRSTSSGPGEKERDRDRDGDGRELRGLFGRAGRYSEDRDRDRTHSNHDRERDRDRFGSKGVRRGDKESLGDSSSPPLSTTSKSDSITIPRSTTRNGSSQATDSSHPSSTYTTRTRVSGAFISERDRDWRSNRGTTSGNYVGGGGRGAGRSGASGVGVSGDQFADSTGVPTEDIASGSGFGGSGGRRPEWMDADPNADMQGGAGVGGGRRMDEMDDLQRFKAMMKAREARGEQVLVAGGEKKEEEYVPGSDSAKSRTHSTEGIGANSTTPALQSNSSPLVGTGAPGLQRGVTKTPVPGNEPQLPLESILPSNSALKTDASQVATEKSSRFAKFFSGGREDQGVGMAPSPQPPLGRPVDSVGAAGVGGIVGGVPPPIEVRAFAGPGREPSPGFMTPQYAAKVPSDGAQTSVSPVQRHLPRQGSDFSQNLAASSEVLPGGVTVFPPQQPSQQSPAHLGMVPSVSAFPQPGRRPMSEQELLQVLGVRPPKPTPGPGMAYPNAPSQPPSADDFQRVMSMLANAKPSGQPPNVNMQMPPAGYPYAMVDRAPPQYVARGGMTPNAPTGPAPGIVRDERMAQGHGGIPRPPYNDGSNVASQFLTNLVQQGIAAGRGTAMGMGRSRYPADVGRGREDLRDIALEQFYRSDGRAGRPSPSSYGVYPQNPGVGGAPGVPLMNPVSAGRGNYEDYLLAQQRAAARQNALEGMNLPGQPYGVGAPPPGQPYANAYPRFALDSPGPQAVQGNMNGYGVGASSLPPRPGGQGGLPGSYGDILYQGSGGVEFMGAATREGQRQPLYIRGRGV